MFNLKTLAISFIILTQLSACTANHKMYTGKYNLEDNDKFSVFNSIMLPVAIVGAVVVIVGAAAMVKKSSSGGGSSSVSCEGPYCNYDAAWDYLPGSDQYRCRSTTSGQFTYNSNCSGQYKQDNWY